MKKSLLVKTLSVVAAILFFSGGNSHAQTLYKFEKNSDGTYGYNTSNPVPLYSGSTEFINLPDSYVQEKNQFKSSWVATIGNLNFAKPSSDEEFKEKYQQTLKTFREWNMNAVIFQVRPMLDSWYDSEINPWSEFLSGSQGTDPGYDPLSYMIDETHRSGMEYHAWLNPYRVTNTKLSTTSMLSKLGTTMDVLNSMTIPEKIKLLNEKGVLADNNYAVLHPENVLEFDEKFFLNPGIPEVRQSVIDTVSEIIEKYDVDAIHFDDYFYPYDITVDGNRVRFGDKNEDAETFSTYNNGITDIQEWRRDNITQLVKDVKNVITLHNQTNRKSVQLGVSPFGIWEHKANNPLGSNTPTSSSKSYSDSIFADTYKWVKEELVDYLSPQIYWSFAQAAAPYGELAKWWNEVAEGTHTQIYIGHANYKHVQNGGWDADWMNPNEIPNQLLYNMTLNNVKGSSFFSYNDLIESDLSSLPLDLQGKYIAKNDSISILKETYCNTTPLVPEKPWLSYAPINAPSSIRGTIDGNKIQLNWDATAERNERYYIIYIGKAIEDTQDAKNIESKIFYLDADHYGYSMTVSPDFQSKIFISSVDAAGVESEILEVPLENITVDPSDISLSTNALEVIKSGKQLSVKATLTPSNASLDSISWSSQKEEIASVDQNGNVTGHKPGITKITATTNNGLRSEFTLRVTQ